jgi:hypothetical protein
VAAKTNTDANAALILQASEANQLLNGQIQQMQQSMNLLQTQVANQGSTQPYYDSYQSQGQQSGGYQQGYQGQGQQYGDYQQSRGYQGRGYQGRGYQDRNYQGRGRGGGCSTGVTRPRNTSIYCWSHGGCGHTSATCMDKRSGHQDNTTFTDKMGGNTRNCQF